MDRSKDREPAPGAPRLFDEPEPTAAEIENQTEQSIDVRKGTAANGKSGYEPPNLGKAIRLPVPNFSDPNRKRTCLELDFPIARVNALAKVEVSSGPARKRVYCMSKWWARRASSVFRTMLIAAATEAPDNPDEVSKRVWDHYYCNHQKAGSFKKLRVLDPFMGGGTTLVEGARLGFQLTGVDLNPIAWFVTRNELACSDPQQVEAFFAHIDANVKPQIQPFYATTCPRGHKGHWVDIRDGRPTADGFDPIHLPPMERTHYRWDGPEVVYTFWGKHGPCAGAQGQTCGHRTPIFRSPVIAEKKLTAYFIPINCESCGYAFNAELGETRMSPKTERVVAAAEPPFTELSQSFAKKLKDYSKGRVADKRERVQQLLDEIQDEPGFRCPHCGVFAGDEVSRVLQRHNRPRVRASDIKKKDLGIDSRHVYMYLLIHPKWFEGTPPKDASGREYGGYAGADPAATAAWWKVRLENLEHIEIRGRVRLTEDESAVVFDEEAEPSENQDVEDSENDEADRRKFGPPASVTLRDGTVDLWSEGSGGLRPADNIEPASRLYLSLFRDRDEMSRDELSKMLRGSDAEPSDLQARGWVRIVGTRVHRKPITERFAEFRVPGRTRKSALKTDLDQAHFLIGVALGGSGLNISNELDNATFGLKRSVDAILQWYTRTARDRELCEAAERAARLLTAWRNKPEKKDAQLTLFSMLDVEES